MDISMRDLFAQRGLAFDVISLRHRLEAHGSAAPEGLRQAAADLPRLNTGSGFESGCKVPSALEIDLGFASKDLGHILPAWVKVDHRDHRDPAHLLEGRLRKARITHTDFPPKPWHTFYDWNLFVEVDHQYRYRLNETTRRHNSKKFSLDQDADIVECEWDSAFVPLWAVPQDGARVLIIGRWIYDCGHPPEIRVQFPGVSGPGIVLTAFTRTRLEEMLEEGGTILPNDEPENVPELLGMHRMEIHPPRGLISIVSEAKRFPGNLRPTRAFRAVVFLGEQGGYIRQGLNDQDYAFDVPLPPKPHPAATPVHAVEPMTGPLVVPPRVLPFPPDDPKLLRVVLPLKGVTPPTREYGAIISAGWADSADGEANAVSQFQVTIEKVVRRDEPIVQPVGGNRRFRRFILFIGVNGRWHRHEVEPVNIPDLNSVEQARESFVDFVTELDLHRDDSVHITATGFFGLRIFDFMGKESGVDPELTSSASDSDAAEAAARKVRDVFLDLPLPQSEGNDPANLFGIIHKPVIAGSFSESSMRNPGPATEEKPAREKPSAARDYVLHYTIKKIDSLLA